MSIPSNQRTQRRCQQVARRLRRAIVTGQHAPGERMPRRADLLDSLEVSATTLQRAFDRLVDEGFVRTAGKAGTFVVEEPPHLSRFALVFPFSRNQILNQTGWLRVLLRVIPLIEEALDVEIRSYFGVTHRMLGDDGQRLVEDCEEHLLGGVIYTADLQLFGKGVLPDHVDVPRITFSEPVGSGVPSVGFDGEKYPSMVAGLLAESSVRRVALLGGSGDRAGRIRERLSQDGITVRDYWQIRIPPDRPQAAYDVVRLLLNPRQEEHPDGLVILDDTLVEQACSGVIASGVRVPDDMTIVAHCNYPLSPRPPIPVKMVGYDAVEMLQIGVRLLRRQLAGENIPQKTSVSPRTATDAERSRNQVGNAAETTYATRVQARRSI